jgi:inorganic pyrophosphatase
VVLQLAMDVFGPIADNAGGIVEMDPGADPGVRRITDRLDAVGNTTKAITKGYAVGSASLACFLLFSAFMDEVSAYSGKSFTHVDIAVPEVFVGGMGGAMLVFYFSGLCMQAVGITAQEIVREVRRQFRESNGRIMRGEQRPDYQRCVSGGGITEWKL